MFADLEDTAINRAVMRKVLSDSEIDSVFAATGQEARLRQYRAIARTDSENKWGHHKRIFVPILLKRDLETRASLTIVDFGAGDGSLGREILAQAPGARVISVDIENNLKSHDTQFVKRSLNAPLDIASGSVDIVCARYVLHHVADLEFAVRDIYRILRPGGKLLILEHNAYSDIIVHLCELEHYLYSVLESGAAAPNYFKSRVEFDKILIASRFRGITYRPMRDSATRNYEALYGKK